MVVTSEFSVLFVTIVLGVSVQGVPYFIWYPVRLPDVTVTASTVQSSFQFNNVDNEIIAVYCWDENNLTNDGSYLITQTLFPLKFV